MTFCDLWQEQDLKTPSFLDHNVLSKKFVPFDKLNIFIRILQTNISQTYSLLGILYSDQCAKGKVFHLVFSHVTADHVPYSRFYLRKDHSGITLQFLLIFSCQR